MLFKNLLRRKTRTLLTLAGLTIGVAAVVALSGFAEGFINSYNTILSSSGADIIVAQGDAVDILYSAVDSTVGSQLAAFPSVKDVSGVLMGMVSTPEVPYFVVFGLDPKEFGMKHYRVVEGEPILRSRELLLGRIAQRNFGKQVGDYYKVQDVSFRIAGIYETGQGVEENGAVISLKDAQTVFKKPNQVAYYQLKLERPDQVPTTLKQLERRFPKLAASRSANYMDNQQETAMLRAMGWSIGLLAVLGGGLGMMNTMLMSVFERTREIGVLRALGWRRRRVLGMILGEALLLSLLGGLLGNLLGVGLIWAVNQVPVLAGFMDNAYSPSLFVQAMVVALLLGAAGGLVPAWQAARLQPVEAMRYDGSAGQSARSNVPGPLSRVGGVALRNLLRQRTRTLLTMLAIGVSVGLVVALGGMGEGMIQEYSSIGGQAGDLTITETKATEISMAAISDEVGRYAAGLPGVAHVSGALLGFAWAPGMPYLLAFGYDPNSFAMGHFAITEGDRMRTPREIIIGRVAARNFKKGIGDSLQIMGTNYRIVGIYETGTAYEDGAVVLSLKEAQRLFKKPNQVSVYGIKLSDPGQAEAIKQQIQSRYSQVSVSSSTDFAEKTNEMQTFRSMVDALLLITLLVGGVGLMNAMVMSVSERTREIGTLRALGWRSRRVIGMILREALLLSVLSGLAGIALGIGLGTLLTLEPTMGYLLKGSYPAGLLARTMLIALGLGAAGAIYPAWRASHLEPIEALRYE